MPNVRMFPGKYATSACAFGARTYFPPSGADTHLDVAFSDADVLGGNGWTPAVSPDTFVGPTSARPTKQADGIALILIGTKYIDTTIGAVVVWDGTAWRHTITGAVV